MPHADIKGASIYYEDTGGEGPVIVLVHGAAGSSACWENQLPAFTAAGYRCVIYDLRGFGKTTAEPGRDTEGSIAGDLGQLVAKLGLPPFFIVAQAYGGFGAIELAIDHPELLRALVVSTSFGGVTEPEYTALRARHIRPDLAELPTEVKELGASYRASNPEGVKRFLAMEEGGYRPGGARQEVGTPTTYARLDTIRTPALVIAADEDLYAPPPVMQAFAEHIRGARFEVVKGAGHCAYWEKPDEWNALVLDFLNQHR
ncbi:MAG TPA: alpha/beta hydrolase [Dehalococcoidia bacterium]|nr:alpha/beta hydrolase [Dehalococcoidia bacterium]